MQMNFSLVASAIATTLLIPVLHAAPLALGTINLSGITSPYLIVKKGANWQPAAVTGSIDTRYNYLKARSVSCTPDQALCLASVDGQFQAAATYFTSVDGGYNWVASSKIGDMPLWLSLLQATACTEDTCFMGGASGAVGVNQKPFLFMRKKTDTAFTAITNIVNQPVSSDYVSSDIANISCSKNVCIAVGTFSASFNAQAPMILISNDDGATWVYERDIQNPPTYLKSSSLLHGTCYGKICLAAGGYSDGRFNMPELIYSNDSQVSFRFKRVRKLLAGSYNGALYTTACNSAVCFAAGYYNINNVNTPLIIATYDQGKSWSKVNLPTSGDSLTPGVINSAVCKSDYCVAVGEYIKNNINQPMILFSAEGKNWQIMDAIHGYPYADNGTTSMETGKLASITCDDKTCTAVGSFSYAGYGSHLILESSDKGQTWNTAQALMPHGVYLATNQLVTN